MLPYFALFVIALGLETIYSTVTSTLYTSCDTDSLPFSIPSSVSVSYVSWGSVYIPATATNFISVATSVSSDSDRSELSTSSEQFTSGTSGLSSSSSSSSIESLTTKSSSSTSSSRESSSVVKTPSVTSIGTTSSAEQLSSNAAGIVRPMAIFNVLFW